MNVAETGKLHIRRYDLSQLICYKQVLQPAVVKCPCTSEFK